jgi:hypothetical protein
MCFIIFSPLLNSLLPVDSIKTHFDGNTDVNSRYLAYDPETSKICILQSIPARDIIFKEATPTCFLLANQLHESKPNIFLKTSKWFKDGDNVYFVTEPCERETLRDYGNKRTMLKRPIAELV